MKSRKIVALLTAGMLVFSMAACRSTKAGTTGSSKTSSGGAAVTATDSQTGASGASALAASAQLAAKSGGNASTAAGGGKSGGAAGGTVTEANLNFHGATVTIMREWDPYPRGVSKIWDMWNDRVAAAEKKFNVKIVEKKWTVTLAQEALSGTKPEGNLYEISSGSDYPSILAGYLADYNDAMKQTGINMKSSTYNQVNCQLNNVNGKQYVAGFEDPRLTDLVLFNKKITSSLGYDIYSLMANKQWTWSKMTEIAKKATVRNAGGEVTQYGLAFGNIVSALTVSDGGNICTIDSKGKPHISLGSQPVRDALQQVYNWCNVDKVATFNPGNLDWTAMDNAFYKGNVAMEFTGYAGMTSAYTKMTQDYGVAYLPMGPRSNKYVSMLQDDYGYVVPIAYKSNAANYLVLLNYLYTLPNGYSQSDRFRDAWIRFFKDAQAYNTFKSMIYTLPTMWASSEKLGLGTDNNPWPTEVGKVMQGTLSPGTLVNQDQSSYQKALEDKYSKFTYTGSIK